MIAPIPPRAGPDVHYEGRYSDEEFDARLDPEGVRRLEALRRQGLDRRDPALYCREHRAVHLPRIVVNRAALRTMRCDPCAFPNEWPDTLARRNTRLRADLERYDWTSRAASVEAPTLIVHGERDFNPVATAQEWFHGGRPSAEAH